MTDSQENYQMTRVRIWFEKTAAMRYCGHLDLHRAWERTFRRARLPLEYSQGFNPRPRLNLAAALPLGFTSRDEVIDAWLEENLSTEEIFDALGRALPPGMVVRKIEAVDLRSPAMQTEVEAAEYQITLLEPLAEVHTCIQTLLSTANLTRSRRGKEYDLRPLILELREMESDDSGHQRLFVRLRAQEGATGRPEEVLEALGADPLATRVERTKLIFKEI